MKVPASTLVYSDCVDLCMCVSVYILTDCLSRPVYMLMHVCPAIGVCLCVSLSRWANGADHRGNHAGAPAVATGDERLHCHLWTA